MEYKITPKKCKHCYYKTNACFNKNGIKCFIGNLKNKFIKKGIAEGKGPLFRSKAKIKWYKEV